MARPLKPIFNQEEIERYIRPTLNGTLRMYALYDGEAITTQRIKTSEEDFLRAAIRAEAFILKMSHLSAPPSYQVRGQDSLMCIVASPELIQLGVVWRSLNSILSGREFKREVMPRILEFYSAFRPFMRMHSESLGLGEHYLAQVFINEFEELLTTGFENFKSGVYLPAIATTTKRLQTRINRNRLQQQKYLDSLLDRYGSLYVVYLDLGYNHHHESFSKYKGYDSIRAHFENFMKERRHNPLWKDDLVGFLWKLSDGAERGYHYHLILFYRGESADQHLQDKEQLYNKWIKEVTGGVGAYFEQVLPKGPQCDFLVPEGVVSREQSDGYERIVGFIHYLNKLDYLIQLVLPKGANVYGRGQMSRY